MRITTRMTLTLTLLALVVLGGYGWYVARRAEAELEDTVARKTRLVAEALVAGIEADLREGRWAQVQDTLARIDHGEIVVRIADGEGELRAESPLAPPLDDDEHATIVAALAGLETFMVLREDDGSLLAHYALPLTDATEHRIGAVFVGQRLRGLRDAIADFRRDAALSVAAFVLAAAAAATWTGRVYLAEPIARLVAGMRRVRAGELARLGAREQTTEIRELGHEFDAMVVQLAATRRDLVAAEAGRVELERRLRRADKLISIGQLAAGIAHEIGSPLQVLVGRARAIATRDYELADVRRHALIIADQGERIAAIVTRLLDYARRHPERPVATDPGAAAATVVDLLTAEAERREVALVCEVEAGVAQVMSPPGALEQIVLNLTLNALEATEAGGTVRVSVLDRAAGVEIAVTDDGRGIPVEDHERVFDAFFTTRAAEGGTGLGLAVVRSLVDELAGRISLVSQPGSGSELRVWLPAGSTGGVA